MEQPPLIFILLAFALTIGPLVFIHEFGHYIVGRWFGIGAESFAIGFGREVFGWTDTRGTRWKVGWLPLGGYVKFVGDSNAASVPGDGAADDPASFHGKPVYQRFLTVLAGPAANFLFAILIFAGFFAFYGKPSTPALVAQIQPASAAAAAGLKPGDRILSIAGQATPNFEDIARIVSLRPDQVVAVRFTRDGVEQETKATLKSHDVTDRFGEKGRIGFLGVLGGQVSFEKPSPLRLIPDATRYTFAVTRSMVDGLGQIIVGDRSTDDLGGPIRMAKIAGQQASLGPFAFAQLMALFSINLGFINLLPVPMLDGGHLALYAIEAVRRRPLGERAQEWAFRGGLALLLALLMFTTINDIASIGLFDGIGRLIG